MPLQAAVKYSITLIIFNLQIAEYLLVTMNQIVLKSQNEFIMSSIQTHTTLIYNITTHQENNIYFT